MVQNRGRSYKRILNIPIKKEQKMPTERNFSVVPFYTKEPSPDGVIAMFIAPINGEVSKIKFFVSEMNVESVMVGASISHPTSTVTVEGKVELKIGFSSLDEPFKMIEGSILILKISDYNHQAVIIEHIAASVVFKGE